MILLLREICEDSPTDLERICLQASGDRAEDPNELTDEELRTATAPWEPGAYE